MTKRGVPVDHRWWADPRLLPLAKTQRDGRQVLPGQDTAVEHDNRVPAGAQHRQRDSSRFRVR